MKRILCLLLTVAVMAMWCLPGFATQETIGPTGSPWTSDAIGSASGYFINNGGAAYTLDVTAGFPNIFTANSGGSYLDPAVTTNNASLSNITFTSGGTSNVYGTIGTGAAFADITLTGATSVNFDGTVNTTTMHVATGTADFKSGTNNNNAAITFTGDGTVTLDANTTVIGALANQATQQGTLNLNSASILNGAAGGTTGLRAINVGVAPGTPGAGISATISGAVKTYLINLYNNTLNIGGALTVVINGVINTSVYSGTDFGKVLTTGAVTIGAGTVINETIYGAAPIIASTSIVSNYTAPITVAVTIGGGGGVTPTTPMVVGSLNGAAGATINLNGAGGPFTLTTGSLNGINAGTDTWSGVISGAGGGFTKVGTGIQVFTGDTTAHTGNTYTGKTTVDSGTLDLDFSVAGAPASDIIANTSTLELDGGTLLLTGKASTTNSQTFNGLILSPGDSYITLTANPTANPLLLTLGAITHQTGGMVNFTNPTPLALGATNGITTTGVGGTGNINGIVSPWATVGSGTTLSYATSNGTDIVAYAGGTGTTGNFANVTSAVTNYTFSAADTLLVNKTGNTLQYITNGPATLALGTNSLTLNGLMNSGTGLLTITGTAGNPGLVIGTNKELDIISNTQGITISSVISDSVVPGGAVVYGGPSAGTLTLSAINTYTGGTFLNDGTLVANNTNALGTIASALSINRGTLDLEVAGTLHYVTTITGNATIKSGASGGAAVTQTLGTLSIGADTLTVGVGNISGGTAGLTFGATTLTDTGAVFAPAAGTLLTLGPVSGAGNSFTVNGAGDAIIGAITTGTGAVTQSGAGTLTLSGANTYSGATLVSGGTLKGGVANNTFSANSAVTVGAAGTLDLEGFSNIIGSLAGAGTVTNSGVASPAILAAGIDGTSTIFAGVIQDGTSRIGLTKQGAGTLYLSNANTYSGATSINGGTLKIDAASGIGNASATNTIAMNTGTLETTASTTLVTNQAITLNGAGTLQSDAGTLTVAGTITNGGNLLTVTGAGSTTINGIIGAGAGGLTKTGAGTLDLTGTNTYTGATAINAGTVQARNTQAFGTGAVSNVTVSNLGTTLDVGTTALTIGGTYLQNLNSTLLLTANSATSFGSIAATGTSTINATGLINVAVGGYIANGATLQIASGAAGSAYGVLNANIISTNQYLTFTGATVGNNFVLTANRAASGFSSVATSSNGTAVGGVLDNVTNPSADMFTVLTALGNSTPSQVASSEKSMTPTNDGSIVQSAEALLNSFTNGMSAHLESMRAQGGTTGIATGDNYLKGAGIWAQGLGDYADQDSRGLSNGYTAASYGVTAGADILTCNDSIRVGLGSGFGQTFINSRDFSGNTDINSIPATIYGEYRDGNHPFYVDAAFTFIYNMYNGSRQVTAGPTITRTADADYNGEQYSGYLEGGYSFFYKALRLTPLASFQYMHLHTGSYTETNAGALDLNVASQDYDMAQTGLGAKLGYPVEMKCGTLLPDLHFKWLYDWIGDNQATTASFTGGGTSFGTTGFNPAQSGFDFGAKLDFKTKYNVTIGLDYDFLFKDDYSEQYGTVTARYGF